MTDLNVETKSIPNYSISRPGRFDLSFADSLRVLRRVATGIVDLLLTWQERANQRFRLEQMNDHMLKDLGISRADVYHETAKPFWKP